MAPNPARERRVFRDLRGGCVAGLLALTATAAGAEDLSARAVQQQQLLRQQQQEALQLRMQQQQRATQNPPQDTRQRQAFEQQQREQVQRQQDLHYRQGVEASAPRPADDPATQRAKDDLERLKAKEQGEALLRRSEAGQQRTK
jgi:hypothetical protein